MFFPVSEDKKPIFAIFLFWTFCDIYIYNDSFHLSHMHPESVPVLIIFSLVKENGEVCFMLWTSAALLPCTRNADSLGIHVAFYTPTFESFKVQILVRAGVIISLDDDESERQHEAFSSPIQFGTCRLQHGHARENTHVRTRSHAGPGASLISGNKHFLGRYTPRSRPGPLWQRWFNTKPVFFIRFSHRQHPLQ